MKAEVDKSHSIGELCINTIRFLSIDAVEKAKSGHPGTPMGAAPMAYVLWDRFLKHNPADPKWPDRDRFVLSAGHASMLLYSLLYLTGYDLTLDDIKQFRQWGSRTPGHPEYGLTPGVEATTGPLGQGFGNGVGMAIAERSLAEHYNKPGYELFNHYTYAFCSDGDIEEGASAEAASLAGTLRLNKLIYLYDDNGISIEGNTDIAFTEDVAERFRAYNWNVIGPIDGMDMSSVDSAIRAAQRQMELPTLIVCRTTIGYGSPNKADTGAVHGEPLGEEEVKLTRENLGWKYEPFVVPEAAMAHCRQARERGAKWQQEWSARLESYRRAFPRDYEQMELDMTGKLREGWDSGLADLFKDAKPMATRQASGTVLNTIASKVHSLMGGAGDLSPSTKTIIKDTGDFAFDECGRNMHFGVREHAMGTIASGMALHGGIIPYTATFLIFYDFMRPPVRLAALMGLHVIYIFTHDSVGLGQDGPTHQPIEQIMGLRMVPNMTVIRPADATETAFAWKIALESKGPVALLFTRQNLPVLDRSRFAPAEGLMRGGYVLWQTAKTPDIILIGTGSEVHIALTSGKQLQDRGIAVRVVSLPSWELFAAQTEAYRNEVLPPGIKARVSMEAGTPTGWERFVGCEGKAIGLTCFGASAPGNVVYEKMGLTPEHMTEEALKVLRRK
ncbi:MAG: transketolase [Dehalococcoidales bacterium]|nr:transketolase [Dehalococcoidales bacterium]